MTKRVPPVGYLSKLLHQKVEHETIFSGIITGGPRYEDPLAPPSDQQQDNKRPSRMVQITNSPRRSPLSPRHFHSHHWYFRKCRISTPLIFFVVLILLSAIYIIISMSDSRDPTVLFAPNTAQLASSDRSDHLRYDKDLSLIKRNHEEHPQKNMVFTDDKPVVIAHVVSLIKCGKQATVTGFLDAAAVLRHSIHKTSIHTKDRKTGKPLSKYSYQMYAIVHAENCAAHAPLLEGLGYKTLIRHPPVNRSDIVNESYRHYVQYENCCGADEFIKLYAYTLFDHPISIHWDMDVAILQPLDELYDSMLYDKDSPEGKAARAEIKLSYPEQTLPDTIDAFYTKDVTSSQPWEIRQGLQGGFLVARPNQTLFNQYVKFITEGNFIQGRGNGFGWDGLGYGGFQGAMAYQGACAYMYDILYPDRAVPVNPCVYNQVVADVLWRGPAKMEHHLQCRHYPHRGYSFENNTLESGACQDCRIHPIDQTKSAHYTACKKPWECNDPKPRKPRDPRHEYRLQHLTNRTTCHKLFAEWFRLRRDFEEQVLLASNGKVLPSPHDGNYLPHAFLGYCLGPGRYIPLVPPPAGFDITKVYGM